MERVKESLCTTLIVLHGAGPSVRIQQDNISSDCVCSVSDVTTDDVITPPLVLPASRLLDTVSPVHLTISLYQSS